MNQAEAFRYPRSYYHDIGFFCSNYMTRLFSQGLLIFLFDQNDGWQDHLRTFIETILLKSRMDDSIAIGAMVLLETFRNTSSQNIPPYPHEDYCKYFLGAYMASHRVLSRSQIRKGFWRDVVGGRYDEIELQRIEHSFVKSVGSRARIGKSQFVDMKKCMYAFIRTHTTLRSGGSYDRNLPSNPGDSPPY